MEQGEISKKSQRLRLYFAKTARDMILESGMEAVSIRNIAAQAGYAYGTIYNHFQNLDELLWLTRSLFMADIGEHIEKSTANRTAQGPGDVCTLFCAYADYFVKHPSVYRFLYFYPLQKDAKKTKSYVETETYSERFVQTFAGLTTQKTPREIEDAVQTILYAIHGLLTLSIAGNDDLHIEDIPEALRKIVLNLLA